MAFSEGPSTQLVLPTSETRSGHSRQPGRLGIPSSAGPRCVHARLAGRVGGDHRVAALQLPDSRGLLLRARDDLGGSRHRLAEEISEPPQAVHFGRSLVHAVQVARRRPKVADKMRRALFSAGETARRDAPSATQGVPKTPIAWPAEPASGLRGSACPPPADRRETPPRSVRVPLRYGSAVPPRCASSGLGSRGARRSPTTAAIGSSRDPRCAYFCAMSCTAAHGSP